MRRLAVLTAWLFLMTFGFVQQPLSALERSRRSLDPFINAIRDNDLATIRALVRRQPELLPRVMRTGLEPLVNACNRDTLACLLELGLPADSPDNSGRTLLHWAALRSQPEVIQLLLDRRADLNHPDQNGATPLLLACPQGDPTLLKTLMAAGGDPAARDYFGNGAIHFAVMLQPNIAVLDLLADAGCACDAPNLQGQTPLMFACLPPPEQYFNRSTQQPGAAGFMRDATIEWLLAHHADVIRHDSNNRTMLQYAIAAPSRTLLLKCIATGADLALTDNLGLTPLDHLLLTHRDVDLVKLLAQHHAPAPYTDSAGNGHLHMRVAYRWALSTRGIPPPVESSTCDPAVPILLAAGFDPNQPNAIGQTPLHRACEGTHFDAAELLLQYHADPNRPTLSGVRPLDIAAARHDVAITRLLIDAGADPWQTDLNGQTALERQLTIALPDEMRRCLNRQSGAGGNKYQAEVELLHTAQFGLPLTLVWIGFVLATLAGAQALRNHSRRLQHRADHRHAQEELPAQLWQNADWKKLVARYEFACLRHAEQLRLRPWLGLAAGATALVLGLHWLDPLLFNTMPPRLAHLFLATVGTLGGLAALMFWNRRGLRVWLAALGVTVTALLAIGMLYNGFVVAFHFGYPGLGLLLWAAVLPIAAGGWVFYRMLIIDRQVRAMKLPFDVHAPPPPEIEDIESGHGWDQTKKHQ